MNYLQTEHGYNRLNGARSNEKYPASNNASRGINGKYSSGERSSRRTNSTQDLHGVLGQNGGVGQSSKGQFAGGAGVPRNPPTQAHQKALLTTQLNFNSSKPGQSGIAAGVKRSGLGSGYSSRNAGDINKVPTGSTHMSSKVSMAGGDHRGSNDYLRMKRVSNNVMNNLINAQLGATGGASSTTSALAAAAAKNTAQQKQRINEILTHQQQAEAQPKTSVLGSGGFSKKSGLTTADSMTGKATGTVVSYNAERAAKHARRLQKASSQGAKNAPQPGCSDGSNVHGAQEPVQKVRLNTQGDDVMVPSAKAIRRKAGSGTRVEQQQAKVTDESSYSQLAQALATGRPGTNNSFLIQKSNQLVKINAMKRGINNKALNDISGILLNNKAVGEGGQIRQIKDLGSNPGSRVGSQKAATRVGDQTTIIKKQQINPANGQACQTHITERFVGSMIRGAPKIGMGAAPLISKGGAGNGTARGLIRESGSQGRAQPTGIQANGSGSHGAIQTTQPMGGAQNRPKKGSCHAIFQRMKGQIQIHDSLDNNPNVAVPSHQRQQDASTADDENVTAEECHENKVYRINTGADCGANSRDGSNKSRRVLKGHVSTRSNDSQDMRKGLTKHHVIRAKDITRARNAGSVDAQKQSRSKSIASTQQSTPEKGEDHQLTLYTEIHRNLVGTDRTLPSPLDTHNISKEYRTKMVDWMVEVTTSFKCTVRTYFLAVAIFDNYLRRMQGKKVLENSDVHSVGVGAMYLASKYEDIYPLHSKVVSDKISHGAFTQKQILAREEEFLKLFQFEMDFITAYDIHSTYIHLIRKRILNPEDKVEGKYGARIEELSLLLIRMAMQNAQFCHLSNTMLVYTCINAAATMLQLSKHSDEQASFYYSDFKLSFMRLANEVEKTVVPANRDFSNAGRKRVNELSEKLIEFYKIFDSWHCGLNQLKTFKSLSFEISVAPQAKVKQTLDIAVVATPTRSHHAKI